MPIRSRLTHRANIERNTTWGLDAYGNALAPTWGAHLSAQPAYYWQSPGKGEQVGTKIVNLYTHQLLLPLGVDVSEADRINGITDRAGNVVAAGVYNIVAIIRKPDHLVLTLESVS